MGARAAQGFRSQLGTTARLAHRRPRCLAMAVDHVVVIRSPRPRAALAGMAQDEVPMRLCGLDLYLPFIFRHFVTKTPAKMPGRQRSVGKERKGALLVLKSTPIQFG